MDFPGTRRDCLHAIWDQETKTLLRAFCVGVLDLTALPSFVLGLNGSAFFCEDGNHLFQGVSFQG
jgi:hypothetical protein